jgi:hypothetical protein
MRMSSASRPDSLHTEAPPTVYLTQVDLTSGVRLGPGVVRYKGQEPYRPIVEGTTTSENISFVGTGRQQARSVMW